MDAATRKKQLLEVAPQDIEETYGAGHIRTDQRNSLMREKAHATVDQMLGDKGFAGAVLAQTVEKLTTAWDDFKKIFGEGPKAVKVDTTKPQPVQAAERFVKGTAEGAKQSAILMWNLVQMATAPINAIGDVTGQQVENWAISAGAPLGLARVLNIAANVGTAFIPIGQATRLGVKGTQMALRGADTAIAKLTGKNLSDMDKMASALASGLRADGVPEESVNRLTKFIQGGSEGGKDMSRRGFLRILGMGAAAATQVGGVGGKIVEGLTAGTGAVGKAAAAALDVKRFFNSLQDELIFAELTDGHFIRVVSENTELLDKTGNVLGSGDSYELAKQFPKYAELIEAIANGETSGPTQWMTWAQEMKNYIDMGYSRGEARQELYGLRKAVREAIKSGKERLAELTPEQAAEPLRPDGTMTRKESLENAIKDYREQLAASKPIPTVKGEPRPDEAPMDKLFGESPAPSPNSISLENAKSAVQEEIQYAKMQIKEYENYVKLDEAGKTSNFNSDFHVKERDRWKQELEKLYDTAERLGQEEPGKTYKAVRASGGYTRFKRLEAMGVHFISGESADPKVQFLDDLAKFRQEMSKLTETQTHEQTAEAAARLGLTLEDLHRLVPGKALDEKEMLAYLKALEPHAQGLIDSAQRAVSGGEAEINEFTRRASAFFQVAPIFRGAEVTAGRSVEILKETPPMKAFTNLLMEWNPEAIAKGDFRYAIQSMAEDFVNATAKQMSALRVAHLDPSGSLGARVWAGIREFYINLLLALPVTQVRHSLGRAIASANSILERQIGATFSIDKKNGLVGQEGWYLLKGMHNAIGDGMQAAKAAFSGMDVGGSSLFDQRPGAIPGVLGSIIRTPGNSVRAADNFMKTLLRRGSYYADAIRDGIHSGLKGDELADFVQRRVQFPTNAMKEAADQFALYNTFQNDLGRLGSKIRDIGQIGPLVFWFPFMKTPINLAKWAWNRTPGLQLLSFQLYRDIKEGGPAADLAIARITMASTQAMFWYNLAQEGALTGAGPVDPGLRRVWMATHQPESLKTSAGWIPLRNFEPEFGVISSVANFASVHNQLADETASQSAMAITFAIMKGLADNTYWRTVHQLVDLAAGFGVKGHIPETTVAEVAAGPLTTMMTGGPLVQGIAKTIDPISRETRTFLDDVISRVPGYSKSLPPIRDAYGDPVLPPQAVPSQWLHMVMPLSVKPLNEDPLKREGDRLGVKLPAVPWNMGGEVRGDFDIREMMPTDKIGVELSPQERDRWQVISRQLMRNPGTGMDALLNSDSYKNATPAAQRMMFQAQIEGYRKAAAGALQVEKPELAKKIAGSEMRAVLPLMQKEDQARAQEQFGRGLELFDKMAPEAKEQLSRWGYTEE